MLRTIATRKIRFLDHTARKPQYKHPTLTWYVEGKRALGRQRLTYLRELSCVVKRVALVRRENEIIANVSLWHGTILDSTVVLVGFCRTRYANHCACLLKTSSAPCSYNRFTWKHDCSFDSSFECLNLSAFVKTFEYQRHWSCLYAALLSGYLNAIMHCRLFGKGNNHPLCCLFVVVSTGCLLIA